MSDLGKVKQELYEALHLLARGGDPVQLYHADALWWGSHPFNELRGHRAIRDVWDQLRKALPDMERRDLIFVAGSSMADPRMPPVPGERIMVASMGHYQGTFSNDLCGIPATNGVVHLRTCEVHHIVDARIVHSYVLLDMLDLMRQANVWPIAPSLGTEAMWPGPASQDGLRLQSHDPDRGAESIARVLQMHAALGTFDGKSVKSMDQAAYWHEDFLWYGPSGIGTTRGMRGFQAHHQIPFLIGFPNRKGAGHYVRIADGDYVVTGGWPSVTGTHSGEWLGLPGTGKHVDMRVMDFYRLDGDRIRENWVPIDILHILKQLGFDVLARLGHLRGNPKPDLP